MSGISKLRQEEIPINKFARLSSRIPKVGKKKSLSQRGSSLLPDFCMRFVNQETYIINNFTQRKIRKFVFEEVANQVGKSGN